MITVKHNEAVTSYLSMGFLKTEADKSRKVGSPNEGFKTLHHKTTGNPILTIKKNLYLHRWNLHLKP